MVPISVGIMQPTPLWSNMKTDSAVAISAAPPAGVGSMLVMGVALADWVLIGTAIYTVLALVVLIRDKFYKPWKEKQGGSK